MVHPSFSSAVGAGLPQHLQHRDCHLNQTSFTLPPAKTPQSHHYFILFYIRAKVLKGGKPKRLGNNLSVDLSQRCEMYSVALNSTIAAQFFIKSDRACIFTVFRFQDHQANSATEQHGFCFKGKLLYFEPFLCLL